jgi:hypothetical protein
MARPALKNVSTTSLLAELQRRAAKLGKLLRLKEQVEKEITDLQAVTGQFGATVAAGVPAVKVGRKRGPKPNAAKAVAAPAGRKKGKRGHFLVNAGTFVLGLLEGRTLTTRDLIARWRRAGRGGKVDNVLTQLVKAGQVVRSKLEFGKGSVYGLAGAAPKLAARQAATKTSKKPAKRGKFAVTAGEFILGLLKDKALSTRQVNEAWTKAGRGGVADSDLSILAKAGKIKREKLGGKLGSNYSLA